MSPELHIQDIQPIQGEHLARPLYTAVIPDATRADWAGIISALIRKSADEGEMLHKTPEDILDLFSKGDSMVLVGNGGKFLSHAAITFRYKDGSVEVGSVCTAEGEQRNGYATDVIEALLIHEKEVNPDKKIITLANEKSKGAFTKLGFTEIDPSEVDKEVWSACKGCRSKRKPPAGANGEIRCCDTLYSLTNFVVRKPVSAKVIFDSRSHGNGTNGDNHVNI